ncbi:MAG: hypothetical protein NZV14_12150 [Bryobacteraceae bacterium]|nr:hypothetical protein [Bryobacteraceae bacterium]MDW8378905.1 hypothetical protein [Bryobacterales bacterium]
MKKIILLTFLGGLCLFSGLAETQQPNTKAPKGARPSSKASAKKPASPATILPKDAKEILPGTYRHVDSKGEAWIYQQTPFGWMRAPESKEQAADVIPTDWTARDEGDSVTFERPYPFGGVKRWTVKKTEMSKVEQAVWQRLQATKQDK